MADEATILELMESPIPGDYRGSILAGWLVQKLTPRDRAAPEEQRGVTPVLPGPKNLKDAVGGVPGLLKGVVVDNVLPIYGAQPLGSGDQPYTVLMQTEDAALAVVSATRAARLNINDIDNWPADVRHRFLIRLNSDAQLRAAVASTLAGRELLRVREIPLSDADRQLADALQMKRENAPKKLGGGNPIVPVVNAAGNSVVNAITALDQLFAANPPDP